MSVIAGWHLTAKETSTESEAFATEHRRLAWLSLGGLLVASAAAVAYMLRSGEIVRALSLGTFALPYTIAAITGVVLQIVAWGMQLRASNSRWLLAAATFGWFVTLLGVSVLREAVRLASVDISDLYPRHGDEGAIGGLGVFVTFAAVNAALIVCCIWLVRRGLSTPASP